MVTEDNSTVAERQKLFSAAGWEAVQRTLAKNIPITYASGTDIIKEYADGHTEIIGKVDPKIKVAKKVFRIS
jgi:hypothetical protein